MSLQPQAIPPIPEETARVARAIFPAGNRYMHLRDQLGTIYTMNNLRHSIRLAANSLSSPGGLRWCW